MLTGRNPFWAATTPEIFAAILTGEGAPLLSTLRPELPPALVRAVAQCLERDPSRRMANVGLLAGALLPLAPAWARDAGECAARLLGARTPLESKLDHAGGSR
jgi:hypothetical protein